MDKDKLLQRSHHLLVEIIESGDADGFVYDNFEEIEDLIECIEDELG